MFENEYSGHSELSKYSHKTQNLRQFTGTSNMHATIEQEMHTFTNFNLLNTLNWLPKFQLINLAPTWMLLLHQLMQRKFNIN